MRIIIPVKPLAQAKSRLSPVLSAPERAALASELLLRVMSAASAVAPVSVVTSDVSVARLARSVGVEVIHETRAAGLDAAARLARDSLVAAGETAMLVLAGDLPNATAMAISAMIARWRPGRLIIAPSGDGGVNALALSTWGLFDFSYGPGSLARHRAEAERCGLFTVVHDCAALRFDIDCPDDLARYRVSQVA